VADSFPSYIDVDTVTTSKGTVQKSAHSFTVTLGPIIGGERIVITAVVKVNSSATKTETLSNIVTLTYGGTTKTASVNYKVVVTGLPGTGELPLDWRERAGPARAGPDQMAVTLLGLLGGLLLLTGVVVRSGSKSSARWMIAVGALMLLVALLVGCTVVQQSDTQEEAVVLPATATQTQSAPEQEASPIPHRPAYEFSTPEAVPIVTLPSYPIPTPEVSVTPEPGEPGPDISPIVRIAIPALVLDTRVAYVPWDGFTWWITGLREEVAWLGNTSWPGLGGNTALAGHVTVRGLGDGPFRHLDELPAGETVYLYTEQNVYTYQVRGTVIVEEGDLTVTNPTENAQIALITCVEWSDELQMYLRRLVVFADLIDVRPIE
jgi:LPXTG-site transpeptidase (sortase) family protein